ncbi:MAG: hypothetical protein PHQ04_02320 [Opitutaceae bacterium]|nr:hypothetical protein [Opitutaceae bacterium]
MVAWPAGVICHYFDPDIVLVPSHRLPPLGVGHVLVEAAVGLRALGQDLVPALAELVDECGGRSYTFALGDPHCPGNSGASPARPG